MAESGCKFQHSRLELCFQKWFYFRQMLSSQGSLNYFPELILGTFTFQFVFLPVNLLFIVQIKPFYFVSGLIIELLLLNFACFAP